MATLRGAAVTVAPARVARVAAIAVVVALLGTAGTLLVAGLHQNAQITDLKEHGVDVSMTVTGCVGQLGGSGSNAAGYVCRGTYRYRAVRYDQVLPGTSRRAPGSVVRVVIAADHPGLVSTPEALARARPSARIAVVPAALTLGALGILAAGVLRARRAPAGRPGNRGVQAGGV